MTQDTTIGGVTNLSLWADGEGIAFLAGGLDVFYDAAIVCYKDAFAFDPGFPADPAYSLTGDNCFVAIKTGCAVPGEINAIAFVSFAGIADTPTLVGTLGFIGLNLGVSPLTMANNDFPAGDWYDVSGNLMQVDYGNAQIGTPVPASIWLFGTGLLSLLGYARKRTVA